MHLLSQADLERLAAARISSASEGPCISIFAPMVRAGAEIRQNALRFKNLLKKATEDAVALGYRRTNVIDLLEPAHRLIDENPFWQHQSDGLAVFIAPGGFEHFCLPRGFEEEVVVADRFHIKPLVPLLVGDGTFFVLALSQKHVRLLKGTHHTCDKVRLRDVPQSLEEALALEDLTLERQYQFHTGGLRGQAGDTIFHAAGLPANLEKERLLHFFRAIDRGLREVLRDERAPLVLAAVEYLHPIYREANTYPHLLEEGIEGNPDHLPDRDLHREAWRLVQPHFQAAINKALERFTLGSKVGRTATALDEVLRAAEAGRVETLFIAMGERRWGTLQNGGEQVEVHERRAPGDVDLLDTAVTRTLLRGGAVFPIESERMPARAPVAAILRY